MELFKLFGTIAVNNSEANQNIEETSEKASGFSDKLENGIKTAAKWGAGIVAGASVAIGGITKFAESSAAAADNVDKMSQKIGISRQAYQELDFICSQSGTSVDTLQAGMKTLTSAMDKAASGTKDNVEQFQRLGVSVKNADGSLRSQEEVMWETMSALQGMENQTEKARLATELFGRSGTELMPLLNGASGSIEEMKNKAHELGLVMDDELVDSGVELTDALDQTKRQFKAIITELGAKLMPTITSKVIPALQKLLKTIGQNAEKLMNALIPAFDFLIEDIFPILIDLITFTVENFKEIVTVVGLVVAAFEALKVVSIVSTALEGATSAMGALNAVMMANPVGAVVTGIVALGAAVAGIIGILSESNNETQQFIDENRAYWEESKAVMTEVSNDAMNKMTSLNKTLQDTTGYSIANTKLEDLKNHLMDAVDAEGKVVEGHEAEVANIKTTLSEGYGIEMDLINGQVKNYEDLIGTIDEVMQKKQQQALLENLERANADAMENSAAAAENLAKAEAQLKTDNESLVSVNERLVEADKNLTTAKEEYQAAVDRADESMQLYYQQQIEMSEKTITELQKEKTETTSGLNESKAAYVSAQQTVSMYSQAKQAYSEANAMALRGEVTESIAYMQDYITSSDVQAKSVEQNCVNMGMNYRQQAEEYGKEIESMKKAAAELPEEQRANVEKEIAILEDKKVRAENLSKQYYNSLKNQIEEDGLQLRWLSEKNGEYMMDGISQGVDSKIGSLKKKLENVSMQIPSYMQAIMKINSPSKLMADEVGQWIPAGIGVGIEENEDAAIEPLQGIADNVVSAGVSKIVPNVASSVVSNIDESSNETSNDNLIQKFDELLAAIKGMKVVMQSGALVGEIATDMDEALDVIAEGKSRGGRVAW